MLWWLDTVLLTHLMKASCDSIMYLIDRITSSMLLIIPMAPLMTRWNNINAPTAVPSTRPSATREKMKFYQIDALGKSVRHQFSLWYHSGVLLCFSNPLQWCTRSVTAPIITGMLNVYSAGCSDYHKENVKAAHTWPTVTDKFPSQRASDVESVSMSWVSSFGTTA